MTLSLENTEAYFDSRTPPFVIFGTYKMTITIPAISIPAQTSVPYEETVTTNAGKILPYLAYGPRPSQTTYYTVPGLQVLTRTVGMSSLPPVAIMSVKVTENSLVLRADVVNNDTVTLTPDVTNITVTIILLDYKA